MEYSRVSQNGADTGIAGLFEHLLVEWNLTPEYILGNWTSELFGLMVDKLVERKERQYRAMTGGRDSSGDQWVKDDELFKSLGNKLKVVS